MSHYQMQNSNWGAQQQQTQLGGFMLKLFFGTRHFTHVLLPAIFLVTLLDGFCLSPAQAAQSGVPGYVVTTAGVSTITTTMISSLGSKVIQYAKSDTQLMHPVQGTISRNNDEKFVVINYSQQTYSSSSIIQTIAQKNSENLAAIGTQGANYKRTISQDNTIQVFHGVSSQAYIIQDNSLQFRIWYALNLPVPSSNIVNSLTAIVPIDKGCNSNYENSIRQTEDNCKKIAQTVAGRMIMRVERLVGSTWVLIADTLDVQPIKVSLQNLMPPPNFQETSLPVTTRLSKNLDNTSSQSQKPAPSLAGQVTSTPIHTGVPNPTLGSGSVSAHPKFYEFWWGSTFADPAHKNIIGELQSATIDAFLTPSYEGPLSQYGIHGGGYGNTYTDTSEPPRDLGTSDTELNNFVYDKEYNTNAPQDWSSTTYDDPIYVIYVQDSKLTPTDWQGYHTATPSLDFIFTPFPFDMLFHPAMPVILARVPDAALSIPFEGYWYHPGFCYNPTPPFPIDFCASLKAFDSATTTVTHEMVEAATDPIPELGWNDASYSNPPGGEIGDICEFGLPPWGAQTLVGATIVSTYWSNTDKACVPDSRPTVTIGDPVNGSAIPWQAGGAIVSPRGYAQDPIQGDVSNQIKWTVDGFPFGPLSLGKHVITGTITTANSSNGQKVQYLSASASVTVTVTAHPPVATISNPLNASSFGTDQTIQFRGTGFDYQDGNLPDSALIWSINGSEIGNGRTVSFKPTFVGQATVNLTVTNSAAASTTTSINLTFTLPTGKPSITITKPTNETFVPFDKPTTFTAVAVDANGNTLPDSAITWHDNLDGSIGTGSTIQHVVSGEACGIIQHHITVTATISTGTASDTITLLTGFVC